MSGLDYEDAEIAEAVRISGRVKWFDPGKGYGFIVPEDPSQTDLKDVLLHITSLRDSGHETAAEGAAITCDVVRRPKGWQVAQVHDYGELPLPDGGVAGYLVMELVEGRTLAERLADGPMRWPSALPGLPCQADRFDKIRFRPKTG